MASNILPGDAASFDAGRLGDTSHPWEVVKVALQPLASLKLTVTLFALSIFLILTSTLAQVNKDIWEIVATYYRAWYVWIDFQVFFPASFFPSEPKVPGGFYFPGGWPIGGALFVNLLAAHLVRFKVQAKGTRLWAGLAVIGLGVLVTAMVILSGSSSEGMQSQPWMSWSAMWTLVKLGLACLVAICAAGGVNLGAEEKVERALLLAGAGILSLLDVWLVFGGNSVQLADESMRILWQLMKGTFAGVVLLIGCMLAFKKRGAIVLIHGGVGLLMGYELYVAMQAVEAQMSITEGQTTHWAQDIRKLELAVVDTSPADTDDVVVVPARYIREGERISSSELPFDIEIVDFMKNSVLRKAGPVEPNKADSGLGLSYIAEPTDASTGTDSDSKVDESAAYIRIYKKGTKEPLTTRLVSLLQALQDLPEQVAIDSKSYDVYLRFHRMYKDYSVKLLDVRKEDYQGTDTPRNYQSDIRLVDNRTQAEFEQPIWMNNPLRYAGETFYQSGYHLDPKTGEETTTLQVVTNSGWMAPYVACMIVGVGLLAQFWQTLIRFLQRKKTIQVERAQFQWRNWALPAVVAIVAAGWIGSKARTPTTGDFDLVSFGRLPVSYEGRVKPFDTLARNALMMVSDRQEYKDEKGIRQPAIRWLLDVIADSDVAEKHAVFRIENQEVLAKLGLERREGLRYSVQDLRPKMDEFQAEVDLASGKNAKQTSLYERKVLELAKQLNLYMTLQRSFQLIKLPEIPQDREGAQRLVEAILQLKSDLEAKKPPLAVPVSTPEKAWQPFTTAKLISDIQQRVGQKGEPAADDLAAILTAYRDNNSSKFNQAVTTYQDRLPGLAPANYAPEKTRFEAFFNQAAPFYYAAFLYLFAFLLGVFAWLGFMAPLNRASLALIAVAFVVHTLAIVGRIYISGRPPVTTLYSSAVFMGWGVVLLGMIVECVFRLGVGNIVASVIGAMTLGIAHFLSGDGDTFPVLQAVLDTQFWLATHVTCITLGYSATALAGMLGAFYVLAGIATPKLTPRARDVVNRMTYGVLCFAIFFSFVGTVLGGLWADDSWGRFWGWDPKENGALIIVLWNAIVLHARWGGLVKERGLAVLASGGLIAVAWSWFGVNELGVGLHSYGFTEGRLLYLAMFVVGTLAIIGVGLLPKSLWWSIRALPVKSEEK